MSKMTIRDRLTLAKAAIGLFSDDSARQAHGMLGRIYAGGRGEPPKRGTKELLRAYSEMPWLRAVTYRVSHSVAAAPWRIYGVRKRGGKFMRDFRIQRGDVRVRTKLLAERKAAGELVEIEEHPMLELLYSPNPFLTGMSTRQLTQVYLDIVGESFWIKDRNGAGVPNAVWPLPPHWVMSTPTPQRRFFEVNHGSWHGDIPDTEILWMAYPNPENPYGRGSGTARALADELETDEYAAKHTKQWFFNRAVPELFISPKSATDELGAPEALRLERKFLQKHQGMMRAYLPHVSTLPLDVKELSQSFKNMELVELRRHERDTIIQVYGVPPEMLGIIENSNRATIDAADYLMARHVLVPRLEFQREILQERLAAEYDDRLIVEYDSPVTEDKAHHLEVAKAAPWVPELNDWRKMMGMEPLEQGGNVHAVPINLTMVSELSPSTPPIDPERSRTAPITRDTPAPVAKGDMTFLLLQRIAENMEPAMRAVFMAAVERVRGTTAAAAFEQALLSGNIAAAEAAIPFIEFETELAVSRNVLRSAIQTAGEAAAEALSTSMGTPITFNSSNAAAVEWANRHSAQLVREISDETRAAIRETIGRVIESGKASRQLAKDIIKTNLGLTRQQSLAVDNFRSRLEAQNFGAEVVERRVAKYAAAQLKRRATLIARTETIRAANMGQQLLWEQGMRDGNIPADARKVWVVTEDDRLDTKVCEPMPDMPENQSVPVAGNFTTGSAELIPCPPAHPGCRCGMRLVVT